MYLGFALFFIRNMKMARSVQAYVRGNAAQFYEWLAISEKAGLRASNYQITSASQVHGFGVAGAAGYRSAQHCPGKSWFGDIDVDVAAISAFPAAEPS